MVVIIFNRPFPPWAPQWLATSTRGRKARASSSKSGDGTSQVVLDMAAGGVGNIRWQQQQWLPMEAELRIELSSGEDKSKTYKHTTPHQQIKQNAVVRHRRIEIKPSSERNCYRLPALPQADCKFSTLY
ncbi:hypothetical protein NL676_008378 [Syzygium grande]|nr:hypothetical protein NL676_008378 [Syzygium grande]